VSVAGAPRRRFLVTLAVLGLVTSPAVRDRDSFPLSTYPVYATVRGREMRIVTAVGEGIDGRETRLSMRVLAATDDPLIAEQRLADAVASGGAAALCTRIASRAPQEVLVVVVVTERHDVVNAAGGEPSRLERVTHARCPVPR